MLHHFVLKYTASFHGWAFYVYGHLRKIILIFAFVIAFCSLLFGQLMLYYYQNNCTTETVIDNEVKNEVANRLSTQQSTGFVPDTTQRVCFRNIFPVDRFYNRTRCYFFRRSKHSGCWFTGVQVCRDQIDFTVEWELLWPAVVIRRILSEIKTFLILLFH